MQSMEVSFLGKKFHFLNIEMGYGQEVRHQILILIFVGSNPATPEAMFSRFLV